MLPTSLMDFERASSSDETGIELHDPSEYLFTMDTSSTSEQVLPPSCKTETNFLRMNEGGEPKSGPSEA